MERKKVLQFFTCRAFWWLVRVSSFVKQDAHTKPFINTRDRAKAAPAKIAALVGASKSAQLIRSSALPNKDRDGSQSINQRPRLTTNGTSLARHSSGNLRPINNNQSTASNDSAPSGRDGHIFFQNEMSPSYQMQAASPSPRPIIATLRKLPQHNLNSTTIDIEPVSQATDLKADPEVIPQPQRIEIPGAVANADAETKQSYGVAPYPDDELEFGQCVEAVLDTSSSDAEEPMECESLEVHEIDANPLPGDIHVPDGEAAPLALSASVDCSYPAKRREHAATPTSNARQDGPGNDDDMDAAAQEGDRTSRATMTCTPIASKKALSRVSTPMVCLLPFWSRSRSSKTWVLVLYVTY